MRAGDVMVTWRVQVGVREAAVHMCQVSRYDRNDNQFLINVFPSILVRYPGLLDLGIDNDSASRRFSSSPRL